MEIDQKPNIPVLCRLCGNYGDHRFESFDSSSEESSSNLSEKILRCLDIEVILSDPTTVICAECFNKLHGYDEFREVCHATNRKMKKSHPRHRDGVSNGVISESKVEREAVTEPIVAYVSIVDSDSEFVEAANKANISGNLMPKIERLEGGLVAPINLTKHSADETPVIASNSSALVKHDCPEIEKFSPKLEMIFHDELVEFPMDASGNESATDAAYGGDDREIDSDERVDCSFNAHGSDSHGEIDTASDRIEQIAPVPRKKILQETRPSKPTVRIKKEHKINKKMKKNASESLVKCSSRGMCSELFENREAMELHLKTYHKKCAVRAFCCHMCKKTTATRQVLKMHMNSMHTPVVRFMCPDRECSKMFTRKDELKIHINAMHKNRVAVRCPKCSKAFFREHLLKKHLAIAHGEGIPFVCNSCTKSFASKRSLKLHIEYTHTHVTLFKCPEATCSKSFNIKSTMKRHFNAVHSQKTVYKCTKCSAEFNWRASLHRHLAVKH